MRCAIIRTLIAAILGILLISTANGAEFVLKSPAFSNNEKIPILFTCDGKNISPALNWENPPANTQSYVLIVSCPDTIFGTTFYSWIVYNLPSDTKGISEGGENLPEGALIGANSFGNANYEGPCPPDDLNHHYVFTLYALDVKLNLLPEADIDEILSAIKYHILKKTQLTGVFKH